MTQPTKVQIGNYLMTAICNGIERTSPVLVQARQDSHNNASCRRWLSRISRR
jgi:hypothetical protein